MPGKPAHPNAADGPMQDRREFGVATPERPNANDPAGDTPDQQGIEIDHESERPSDSSDPN